jgi:hypothetical protein
MIYDFYVEEERSKAASAANSVVQVNDFGKSLFNLSLGNKWVDLIEDPNETIFAAVNHDEVETVTPANPPKTPGNASRGSSRAGSRAQSQATNRKIATPDPRLMRLEKKKRLPHTNFIDSEIRLEGALKFTPIWLESFLIFSMVWTFYPILSDNGRK